MEVSTFNAQLVGWIGPDLPSSQCGAEADPEETSLGIPSDMDQEDWEEWFAFLSESDRSAHRSLIILAGLSAGVTLDGIGEKYGVTRERIRQIALEQGVVLKDLRAKQKIQAAQRQKRICHEIQELSRTHPELTVAEIADWLDADESFVCRSLGPRLVLHDPESSLRPGNVRTSEADLLQALADWSRQSNRLTGDDYSAWADERGLPGKQTIAIRFGSWNAALKQAGVHSGVHSRGGVRPIISDAELWATVLQFTYADLPRYTYQSFDEYTETRGWPSAVTVRNRFGSWSGVHATAQRLRRYAVYRDGTWELGEAVLKALPREFPRNEVTKDDARRSLIATAARFVGPCTVAAYEHERKDDEAPANAIQRRYGSWAAALVAAGLSDRLSGRARGKLERGEIKLQ